MDTRSCQCKSGIFDMFYGNIDIVKPSCGSVSPEIPKHMIFINHLRDIRMTRFPPFFANVYFSKKSGVFKKKYVFYILS